MEWNQLYPQDKQPSFDAMADYIGGEGKRLWISLFDYMSQAFDAKPKLTYSGCSGKPGWNVKFSKSGQSFGTLYPEEGFFSVFMVISYKHGMEMDLLKQDLSKEMRLLYDNAQDYMKMGKWMMFEIRTERELQDYITFMSVKKKPKCSFVLQEA